VGDGRQQGRQAILSMNLLSSVTSVFRNLIA
jgi:hypothetical protein